MPSLYLKKFRETERIELGIDGSVEELPVKELRDSVVEKLNIANDELCLVYGGRVLKSGKTLGHYKAANGSTIHVLTKQSDKKEEGAETSQASGSSSLINNPRILRLIGRILSNPSVLQSMIEGTPLASSDAMRQALSNPELLASLSDPVSIQQYLHSNPHMAIMMEGVLRAYSMLFGGTSSGEDEGDIVSMVENSLEEDMELAERDTAARELANAQEQMFEHSQALHAHQQQTHQSSEATPIAQPTQETSYNASTSQQHGTVTYNRQNSSGGGGISHEQLASALAGAMSSSMQGSPLTSLNYSNPSGPSSLYSDQQPSSLEVASGSTPSNNPSTNQSGPITADNFQRALAGALSSIQSTPSRPEVNQPPVEQRLTLREKYMAQLEQLHIMGITDDAACLHALEATNGDLQSALELLYSR